MDAHTASVKSQKFHKKITAVTHGIHRETMFNPKTFYLPFLFLSRSYKL